MSVPALSYTQAESESAHKEWKATCGPHAIAASLGLSLDGVRSAMLAAGITYKGWMSPTYVSRTLDQLGAKYQLTTGLNTMNLCNGINRVQWEGPWLNSGVPARVAYFHTHLIACFEGKILCTCCKVAEWIDWIDWLDFHLRTEPVTPFHITHHWTLKA